MGFLSSAIGSIFGSKSANKAESQAINQGFDYLKENENVKEAQASGLDATGLISGLLGLGGDEVAATQAFDRFKDSTGYQFRMDEGIGAIQGSRAARGILNSGATSKELMKYGQGLASQEFGNFLGQLGAVEGTGLTAAYSTGSAGSQAAGQLGASEADRRERSSSGLGGLISTGLSLFGF